MPALLVDPATDSSSLLRAMYAGDLVVMTKLAAVSEFRAFAREQLNELFGPHPLEEAHEHFDPETVAKLLATWKPAFIHHPRSKALVCQIIREAGFPVADTYYDLPKPRTAFPLGHLTTGIAFAFPWHRDTWYSAPQQQINWWLPISEISTENAMMFDPGQFEKPVANTSNGFDYYRINVARATTASQVRTETQSRPAAADHTTSNGTVVLPGPGSVLLFSGSQLHASIPNTSGRSRFSIDFRTVSRADVASGVGAPRVDVECTGTALRDFVSVESQARFEEEFVQQIYGPPPSDAVLVYEPAGS
jgi:hypothetical protein